MIFRRRKANKFVAKVKKENITLAKKINMKNVRCDT